VKTLSTLLPIFLTIQVVIAARGSLAFCALSPRNDSDYNNKNTTP
jgi:hypothetical protein